MQESQSVIDSLKKYIELEKDGRYGDILAEDDRFEVFNQLSETRRSLFNWYEFKKGSSLLELNGEYGALTGLFCENCKSVMSLVQDSHKGELLKKRHREYSNLRTMVGEKVGLQEEKFDYIVSVGQLEYAGNGSKGIERYSDYLKRLLPLLKKGGTILLAVENRYGLRYFCGEKDPFTEVPFAGLNRYPDGSEAYPLSRQEIIKIIGDIPDMAYKFYYPVPDYHFPQLIFTDAFLPQSSLRERIIPYYRDPSTLVMNESKLYDDIVDNGVFPFFSNSFLIECSRESDFSSVVYAALSTDRGREHGFATTIDCYGKAQKKALYPEGRRSLQMLVENILDLEKHGIDIVPHSFDGEKIEMPRMELPTLSDYLKRAIKKDPKEFTDLFDLLYEQILKSSDQVEADKNLFPNSSEMKTDWGPILKRSYIDMIPINCFYDGTKLYFYDQEFVRENFPAGYTMYRALKYTYQFITFAKEIVPLEQMAERYRLTEVWDYYKEEEARFVASNRDYKTYGHYMQWSRINGKMLKSNIKRLMGE